MRGYVKINKYIANNILTEGGKEYLAGMFAKIYPIYLGFGTGTTPQSSSDTKLEEEVGRVIADIYPSGSSFTIRTSVSGLSINECTEFGLFSGPNVANVKDSGVLIARTVFEEPISVDPTDIILIEWYILLDV